MTTRAALSPEQEEVLELVKRGNNVFFTGHAGTGKSFTLEAVIEELRTRYAHRFSSAVAITATTGIAASHIGGQTLNAALGIGAVNHYRDFASMAGNAQVRQRIRGWEVLIVDEVSMLSAEMFEEVERQFRQVRQDERPAGGVQLVLTGDFKQLPPVSKPFLPSTPADAFMNYGFAFMAPAWKRCAFRCVVLGVVFRQRDPEMVQALGALREGPRSKAARKALRSIVRRCARPLDPSAMAGIVPTQIFSKNRDVDETNDRELRKLLQARSTTASAKSSPLVFRAEDEVYVENERAPDAARQKARLLASDFFRDCLARPDISLCVGAQVMLLKNFDTSLGHVNGSRGVVTGFVPRPVSAADFVHSSPPFVGADNPASVASLQSALSCWKGGGGKGTGTGERDMLPVMRFATGEERVIPPAKYSSFVHGAGECVRWQIPLKLAWAITVHKSQGLSLDAVCVSLRSMFAVGQAYVALSRARSLDGLQVLDWDVDCLRTDGDVACFYDELSLHQQQQQHQGRDEERPPEIVGDVSADNDDHHHRGWNEYLRLRESAAEAKKKKEEKQARLEKEQIDAQTAALKKVRGDYLFQQE